MQIFRDGVILFMLDCLSELFVLYWVSLVICWFVYLIVFSLSICCNCDFFHICLFNCLSSLFSSQTTEFVLSRQSLSSLMPVPSSPFSMSSSSPDLSQDFPRSLPYISSITRSPLYPPLFSFLQPWDQADDEQNPEQYKWSDHPCNESLIVTTATVEPKKRYLSSMLRTIFTVTCATFSTEAFNY